MTLGSSAVLPISRIVKIRRTSRNGREPDVVLWGPSFEIAKSQATEPPLAFYGAQKRPLILYVFIPGCGCRRGPVTSFQNIL
jgi:hypothetical protein